MNRRLWALFPTNFIMLQRSKDIVAKKREKKSLRRHFMNKSDYNTSPVVLTYSVNVSFESVEFDTWNDVLHVILNVACRGHRFYSPLHQFVRSRININPTYTPSLKWSNAFCFFYTLHYLRKRSLCLCVMTRTALPSLTLLPHLKTCS